MAIEQDHTVTVGTGATAKTFGVSKSLDNYTLDDLKTIADWSFSAFQDNTWNANILDGSYHKTAQIWDTGRAAAVHLYKFPNYQIYIEGSRLSGALFTRNVLIYCNTNVNWAGANIYSGLSTLSRYHIVTDIEIQELKLSLGSNPDTVVSSMPGCTLGINSVRICPMQLIIDDEDNIYLCLFQNWNGAKGGAGNRYSHLAMRGISYDNVEIAYYNYNSNNGMKAIDGTGNKVLAPSGINFALHDANNDEVYTAADDVVKVERTSGGGYNYFGYYLQSANADLPLLTYAFSGIRFNDGANDYKPIVANGMIIGYTSDMSEESEWDTWENIKDHVTPSGPSPTPPGPSYDDDPWSGVSFSGVGLGGGGAFARCYYMTSTELANLRSWMCGINVPEGFNPMAQIIGLSQVPVALSGDALETVQFINSSAVYDPGVTSRVVDSGVSTQYSMGGPIKYSLGSVNITRRMQERGEPYLDYSCQIELYLPLIGVFSLDTQAVMGRTLEAEAILDPISGTLAAYAWVSKDGQKLPVAYGSTTISVDLPVSAQQYSVSKAALKQANAQLGTSLLSSVATLVAAAVGGGKAEGSNARVSGGASSMQGARGMNSYAQASSIAASQAAISQTGNVVGDFMQWGRTIKQLQYGNNTAISGSFGGSVAQWSFPFQAYVKINRPRYEKPENYAHTQGVPCVQKKRIGDCTGFIQCIGVDVDNHIEGATDLERQAIQAALSNGIYAGGGGE